MPIRLLVQKQASAPYILMSIIAKALQCTHSILKRNKRKTLCSYTTKSRRLSTAGASIEELEYTSNPFEWILNS